jgi:hypothetical protein
VHTVAADAHAADLVRVDTVGTQFGTELRDGDAPGMPRCDRAHLGIERVDP